MTNDCPLLPPELRGQPLYSYSCVPIYWQMNGTQHSLGGTQRLSMIFDQLKSVSIVLENAAIRLDKDLQNLL